MMSNGPIVQAWPSNCFREPLETADATEAQRDLQQCWLTLEQRKRRLLTPTPIQLHVWPIMLLETGLNVVGIAPTGSGKTLAYGLPLARRSNGNALVLVPTRELASQVERELAPLSKKRVICIYGGVDRESQLAALKGTGPWIVTATPGRLVDILGTEDFTPLMVDSIVLDEGDHMASNSDIARQVDEILRQLRPETTTPIRVCLFSATYPAQVEEKWNEWVGQSRVCIKVNTMTVGMRSDTLDASNQKETDAEDQSDYAKSTALTSHDAKTKAMDFSRVPTHVTQILHVCAAHKKPRKLLTTLQQIQKDEGRQKGLCLVFFSRIKTLQYIHMLLNQEGTCSVTLPRYSFPNSIIFQSYHESVL
jgi:superfamily II DNA/RNA helicase